jgi:hypothetical protein
MTIEQIYCDLADDLRFKLYTMGGVWSNVASRLPIENYDGYGIVVWCDEDGDGKYWLVSIRENFSDDDWGKEIFEELTIDDSWEELEGVIIKLLREFYNMKEAN